MYGTVLPKIEHILRETFPRYIEPFEKDVPKNYPLNSQLIFVTSEASYFSTLTDIVRPE